MGEQLEGRVDRSEGRWAMQGSGFPVSDGETDELGRKRAGPGQGEPQGSRSDGVG